MKVYTEQNGIRSRNRKRYTSCTNRSKTWNRMVLNEALFSGKWISKTSRVPVRIPDKELMECNSTDDTTTHKTNTYTKLNRICMPRIGCTFNTNNPVKP